MRNTVLPNLLTGLLTGAALAFTILPHSSARADNVLGLGQALAQSTYLVEISQDTRLSLKVRGLRYGGFESSEGRWIGFDRWYRTDWLDTRLSWMTQVTPNLGLLWGFNTGERAEKYTIDPGLRLGLLMQTQPGKNSTLRLTGSTVVGGRLREKACTATYALAGQQEVNCRLAASILEPSQTLQYLANEKPETSVQVRYQVAF